MVLCIFPYFVWLNWLIQVWFDHMLHMYMYLQVCWFPRVESLYEALFFLLFRGMVDASGDQFVAYFLPTKETIGKRKRDLETEMDYTEDEEWVEVNSFKCSSVRMQLHRADISHCHQSFPHKMKSEKPTWKFHTDEVSLSSFAICCATRPIRSIT